MKFFMSIYNNQKALLSKSITELFDLIKLYLFIPSKTNLPLFPPNFSTK